ncbi:MAG: DUF1684 domain-containing protein [Bryobacter sp.]|nr:DUF1684 domain-containing protein [Bryobacter sp.]
MSINSRVIHLLSFLASGACLTGFAMGPKETDQAHKAAVTEWRQKVETSLKNDTGWLTVAGLHWLAQGETTFGSGVENQFVLPAGKAPAIAGKFHFDGTKVTLDPAPGAGLLVNGKPAEKMLLRDDAQKEYDVVSVGDLSFFVIVRGDKTGIRLRDKNSKYRQAFTHRDWFPVKAEYLVEGEFFPFAEPKKMRVPTVIEGVMEDHESPGEVEFLLNGAKQRVQVLKAGANQVWLIFRDKSSGKSTYPAGRFLYGEKLASGKVLFDFNKAYNPPCAFTPFATCPLPPRQNSLTVAVEAGELNYHVEP